MTSSTRATESMLSTSVAAAVVMIMIIFQSQKPVVEEKYSSLPLPPKPTTMLHNRKEML